MLVSLPIFDVDDDGLLVLLASDELKALLDDAFDDYVARNPFLLPLRKRPVPWTGVWKGAVPLDPDWPVRVPLVSHPKSQDAIHKALRNGTMKSWALDGINALQKVPFVINGPVLEVAQKMQPVVPPLPKRLERLEQKYDGKIPSWLIQKIQEGNDDAAKWYAARAKAWSYEFDMTMATILNSREQRQFYIPLTMDFRGRLYGVSFFNYQRGDHVRGLTYFAKPKQIGVEGLKYLKAHVAKFADGNDWDDDPKHKPSRLNHEQRVAWTVRYKDRLYAIGEAVRRGDVPEGIEGVDDKIQFIAACHELFLAGDNPNFETRLPITFDGRCNGLQHLCNMTRSEDGKYAGLVLPSEEPDEDFYERVAASANKSFIDRWFVKFKDGKDKKGKDKIKLKVFPTEAEADDFAKTVDVINSNSKYIDVEIDRAIVKQPVLSYFYGATQYGMTKQVAKFLKKNALPTTGASKIAKAINDAVEQVAPDAVAVRSFLEELSDLYYDHEQKEMRWPNVFGVPIINISGEPVIKRPSKKINGRKHRSSVKVGETGVDKDGARQSIIANFVHSQDAALLQMVARHVDLEGIPMVAVHDSFGFLASDVPQGRRAVLYYFSEMYEFLTPLHDLLEQAKKDLPPGTKLPKLPKFGKLERAKILQSEAFR